MDKGHLLLIRCLKFIYMAKKSNRIPQNYKPAAHQNNSNHLPFSEILKEDWAPMLFFGDFFKRDFAKTPPFLFSAHPIMTSSLLVTIPLEIILSSLSTFKSGDVVM
eukprot:TCONS_00014758-protein